VAGGGWRVGRGGGCGGGGGGRGYRDKSPLPRQFFSAFFASIAGSCSFCKKNQKLGSFSRKRTKKGLDIY
jgi:hypothetical protein